MSFLEKKIPIDLFKIIKTFLTNKEIIELICSSTTIFFCFKSVNLFSTITITIDDWFIGLKRYCKHHKSIKKVTLLGFTQKDVEELWPFEYSLQYVNVYNESRVLIQPLQT